jgi:hypothetical protein
MSKSKLPYLLAYQQIKVLDQVVTSVLDLRVASLEHNKYCRLQATGKLDLVRPSLTYLQIPRQV